MSNNVLVKEMFGTVKVEVGRVGDRYFLETQLFDRTVVHTPKSLKSTLSTLVDFFDFVKHVLVEEEDFDTDFYDNLRQELYDLKMQIASM